MGEIIPSSQVSWELKESIVCHVFTVHGIVSMVMIIGANILCALTMHWALLDDLFSFFFLLLIIFFLN